MGGRSDSSLAALLLTQRLVETPVAPLKSSEYWALLDTVDDPAVLLGLDTAAIAGTAGVDPCWPTAWHASWTRRPPSHSASTRRNSPACA